MKKILCIVAIVASAVAVMQSIKIKEQSRLIEAYDAYNKHTEELLDTLNSEYDWVDAFDPYDYYESRAKLDSLIWSK